MKKQGALFSNDKEKLSAIKELNMFRGILIKANDLKFLVQNINIKEYSKNTTIIEQNTYGNDIFFIFNGSVDIIVNGKKVAIRKPNEHIGEIAALFKNMKRTATNIVAEDSYLGSISSDKFIPFLERNPLIYKQIANVLAQRLEQRNCMIRNSADRIKIFLGSSKQGLRKMNQVVKKLKDLNYDIRKWNSDVFTPSKTNIENLEKMLDECDFGIVVLTPDDKGKIRGKRHTIPRDNLIFELGLLMGAISRSRTFFFISDKKLKTPTDLEGVTHLTIKDTNKIIDLIEQHGCR